MLGDPESPFVSERGHSEGIDDTMPAKVRSAIAMFRPLHAVPNAEIRLHGTILYNSIYRGDDQLLVNTHIYGIMANNAPVFHLRKIPGGEMATTYLESFERVWRRSTATTRRERRVSPRRIDYYDDPDAPKANSLVPSVNVVVVNDAGEILMIRRSDNDNWAVPGGAIDLGESVAQAAVRETLEESGIECEITGIIGIYSDPKHVILYTSNGEVRQEFSIVLTAHPLSGQPTPSSESSEVRWVPVSAVS